MKKLLSLTCVLLLAATTYAQPLQFGLKAGLNQGSLSKAPNLGSAKTTTGFVGGAFFRVKFLGLFAQPELLYSQRRGVFADNASGQTVTNTLSYIDIPALIGYKILVFRVNAGPNFQFLVDASQDAPDNLKDPGFSKKNFNKAVVGLQAGIGLDLGKFQLDVRYDGTIGNLGKKVVNASGTQVDYSTRSNMYQITLGYRII